MLCSASEPHRAVLYKSVERFSTLGPEELREAVLKDQSADPDCERSIQHYLVQCWKARGEALKEENPEEDQNT